MWAKVNNRGIEFRVWAPLADRVALRVYQHHTSSDYPMCKNDFGYHSYCLPTRDRTVNYHYVIHGRALPDPCSTFQPHGVHGFSQTINLAHRSWGDSNWEGLALEDLILYELHVGTFTAAGTYAAVCNRVEELVDLGITAILLMPLAQCPGRWNWGYDGVNLFAPNHNYGTPEELCCLIDKCHQCGLAVLLDVVYNHLGPEGNYLSCFGPYFRKEAAPWGDAPNFEEPAVREFVLENVRYWLELYHFDGLRLDAIQTIYDQEARSIVNAIGKRVSELATQLGRQLHVIGESNAYDPQYLPTGGGALSALWLDDLGHAAESTITARHIHGERQYAGLTDLLQCLSQGYLYASQPLTPPFRPGQPEAAHLQQCVNMLQNHDIIGNGLGGLRIHALSSPELQQVCAALVLLYPSIPLIFMGEEYASPSPFHFFTDFADAHLKRAVVEGRKREFPHHAWDAMLLPTDSDAFYQSKINRDNAKGASMREWYKTLLQVRKNWQGQGFLAQRPTITVTGEGCFEVAYVNSQETARLKCDVGPPFAQRAAGYKPKLHIEAPSCGAAQARALRTGCINIKIS